MVLVNQLAAALAVCTTLTVAIPKTKVHHPAVGYARALHKFGMKVPKAVQDAADKGSVPTTPTSGDEQYVTKVTVGEGELNLDLDTGSGDLWVFSTETPDSQSEGHNLYKPSSSSKRLDGYSWEISYGDMSSAGGDVFLDAVTIGNVTASSQAVESAKMVSDQFAKDKATDGLMGLSFSVLNTSNLPDFTLSIGGYNAVVPGKFINYQPIDGSTCFGGLQSGGSIGGPNIFGDVFLKSQFVVWDTQGPRIGFAPQA
ncbi:hypothetical protein FQN49_008212 [Arthroderma sp. PD_2]|nr:hypothetical protein FQN49_008212 [Arthroderma sp. PD_2]